MDYKIVQNLVEDLSLEFVLSDASEPESLSAVLPILEQLQKETRRMPENTISKELSSVPELINDIIESKNVEKNLDLLDRAISEMKSFLNTIEISDSVDPVSNLDAATGETGIDCIEKKEYEKIELTIETFSRLIYGFCPGEIPDLGAMLNILDQLVVQTDNFDTKTLSKIAGACKNYVGEMTMKDIVNTKPIEEGVVLLKSVLSHLKRGEAFAFDYSDVLELLEIKIKEKQALDDTEPEEENHKIVSRDKRSSETSPEQIQPKQIQQEKISDDDMEILIDFVSEAEENLDTIEVSLIDLEQDPSNNDIINDIFRPFHTIKGVSGFLSLTKINKLAHTTENLLDSARSGDFLINDTATDTILESVDTLKRLLGRVKKGTSTGFKEPDDDIDIDDLRQKLQKLQAALVKGDKEPLGEILVKKGVISRESLDQSLEFQKDHPDKKIGQILVEEKKTRPAQLAEALVEQNQSKKQVDAQVKVSTQKLDDLVDYAGELVIAQSMLRQRTSNDPSLSQSVAQLGQIVTNMQNIAMSMRMIPIKTTFMKMIRLVRDLSKKSGKKIILDMEGEDTEIDRNVVDALYDPMVHMIRNSVDHGIESDADRLDKGKPSKGNITLRAYHKGGHIIIEIEDDGKGLDQDQILEKATSTGLISGNEQLTDGQIYDLILQPGFSTAKEITDVSGRGVGMDVVKNGIEKFRGQLNIDSSKGEGTKFTISFPLTLAIIDGMLVRVDDERYVIPTMAIQKAFKPAREDCFTVRGEGEMVKDRGSLVPVIRLNEMYNSSSHKKPVWDSLVVVVESKDEKRALLIDELLGKDEYVIKSLGNNLEDIKSLAGGAILADGRVGLILDIHGIFSLVSQSQ